MSLEKLMESPSLEVLRLVVGPVANNAYIVRDPTQRCCVLIDAPFEGERILAALGTDDVTAILLTHAHMDHIHALPPVREQARAPVGIHPLEPGGSGLSPDFSLEDGQRIPVGNLELEVLHTPGHTPGSVCFLLRPSLCFCGDTVFPGGPGKTGSPEAFERIVRSLETKIYTLHDAVRLLPGHGEGTGVGASRAEYERFRGRTRKTVPFGDVLWAES